MSTFNSSQKSLLPDVKDPVLLFSEFLENLIQEGWIDGYCWDDNVANVRRPKAPGLSKTNKRVKNGVVTLVAWKSDRSPIGIDLDHIAFMTHVPRSRFVKRLIASDLSCDSPNELLRAWCAREAAYKAMYPHQLNHTPFDLEILEENLLALNELRFTVRSKLLSGWCLCVAKSI